MTLIKHQGHELIDGPATIGIVARHVAFCAGAMPRESFSRIRGRMPDDPHSQANAAPKARLASSIGGSANATEIPIAIPRSRIAIASRR